MIISFNLLIHGVIRIDFINAIKNNYTELLLSLTACVG